MIYHEQDRARRKMLVAMLAYEEERTAQPNHADALGDWNPLDQFDLVSPANEEMSYRLLVDAISDYAIYMLNPQGLVASWNQGAQRFKGYAAQEIIGRHFSIFFTPEDREAGLPEQALRTAAAQGRWEHEGVRVRKDGTRFRALAILDAIRDDSGALVGFAKVTRDITERVEAQRALDDAREVLFQSQKLEAVGQLSGGIAHDFNNLLSAVLGGLELARKRLPYDVRVTPHLDNAYKAASRGAALTERLLAFARRKQLKLEPVDLSALVLGWRDFLERAIGPGVSIVVDMPGDLPLAYVDANQFENALLNIALNARDAMPGGGTITISAQPRIAESRALEFSAGPFVCLTISDTGEGMDRETLARATEPFFTTKGPGKGSGLGLSMVHGMMAQSGGAIRISSRQGEGTSVELWFRTPTGDADQARETRLPPPAEPASDNRSYRVLAVDDDGLVLMNTISMLEDLGHQVLDARSGPEAVDVFNVNPEIDLLITDQAMPGMTGAELGEILRRGQPDLPVLIATGYAEIDPTIPFPRLAKPFSQSALAQAARAAVAAARSKR